MPEFLFSHPGAARLASLEGIKADLDRVLEYCDRMIERYAGSHLKKLPFDIVGFTTHVDFIDWEALSTAACVTYARCFCKGERKWLDKAWLEDADSELRSTHQFVKDLRDKHVAHSVNSFEENSVTVHIEDSFQSSAEICSAVPRHERQAGLSFDTPAKLQQLASWLLAKVRQEIAVETERVVRLAQAMPLEQVRAFGTLKSSSPENRRSSVNRPRRSPRPTTRRR